MKNSVNNNSNEREINVSLETPNGKLGKIRLKPSLERGDGSNKKLGKKTSNGRDINVSL